ncbi:MAG TPA: hypothetical protein VFE96_09975 [Candidatus Bathyarchaeia archaeon]|jgi:hypothetical protein|nr:hypothetical protein [Candidatus Bathyarchaeia archaeon]
MSSAMGEIVLDSIRDQHPEYSEEQLLNAARRRIYAGRGRPIPRSVYCSSGPSVVSIRKKFREQGITRKDVDAEIRVVGAEGGKVVFRKVPSIFDLAGKSKMTKDEAFKRFDKTREEN